MSAADVSIEPDRRIVRVGDWSLVVPNGSEEPLVEDEELAKRLGYRAPRQVRELIKRLIGEGKIRDVSSRRTVRRGLRRGNQVGEQIVDVFLLTEEQALKVIAKSETKAADQILDSMIRVFRAAMRGLLVPADVRLMQGELLQLRSELDMLKLQAGRVVGERQARTYILDPLKEAARLTAVVRGDMSRRSVARALKEHDKSVRMHVQYPDAIGQAWATLPIERLGNAQAKVAEILARARREAAPVLQFAKAVQASIDFTPATLALAEEG